MTDLFLKTTTRAALVKKLTAASLMDSDGNLAPDALLDEIGTIDGVKGYHANLRVLADLTDDQTTTLSSIVVPEPDTPYRVWA